MVDYKYAIEIGGANTKIYIRDNGLALCEPTLVAAEPTPQGYKVIGLGQEAKKLMGKTNDSVEVFSPVINGVVKNYEYCIELLTYLFKKVEYRKKKDNVVVLVNCALSREEKQNYLSLFHEVGFREVTLVPTVVCTCLGAGKNISSTKVNMVVNIGGANTDIAVINMNSILKGGTLGIGGRAMDVAISHTIAYNHGIIIGLSSAETLKNEVGSLFVNDTLNMEVTGVDVETKIPKSYIITSSDILPVIEPYFDEIGKAVDVTITSLPPEISTDIINSGVIFAGGVSQIAGLDNFLKRKFRYPFTIADDAENISILGAGKLLEDPALLAKIVENF